MNRTIIETSLKDLNTLVQAGRLLEAFDKYYHEDVAMQENMNPPVVGKQTNRKREIEFLNNIVEFRSASVQGLGVGEDISFIIWSYDYTHKEWGVRSYTQVSVQNWKDGKIIKEQFFYGN
jgi:hypothetical protein